jgi:hypothetical protein
MFSRFAHSLAETGNEWIVPALRHTLDRLQPPDAVFAELRGSYDSSNLNLHPQVTDYELACPGEISMRPAVEQIPLTDLFLQDDVYQGRLRLYSKRLNKEVIPVYLGFLLPMMLPAIQQVLLNFSSINFCMPGLWLDVSPARSQDEQDGVLFYPRICYKHLMLQRAMWKMPLTAFPSRASQEADSDYFQRILRWQKQHHLPARVFLRIEAPSQGESAGRMMSMRKPLFVDFTNYFSVALLESVLRKATGQLVLSEMLPGREDLWFEYEGKGYVTELLIEMSSWVKEVSDAE